MGEPSGVLVPFTNMDEFTLETPLVYEQCGKVLSSANSLQNHERIHRGERPYECQQVRKPSVVPEPVKNKRTLSGEKLMSVSNVGKPSIP